MKQIIFKVTKVTKIKSTRWYKIELAGREGSIKTAIKFKKNDIVKYERISEKSYELSDYTHFYNGLDKDILEGA